MMKRICADAISSTIVVSDDLCPIGAKSDSLSMLMNQWNWTQLQFRLANMLLVLMMTSGTYETMLSIAQMLTVTFWCHLWIVLAISRQGHAVKINVGFHFNTYCVLLKHNMLTVTQHTIINWLHMTTITFKFFFGPSNFPNWIHWSWLLIWMCHQHFSKTYGCSLLPF